jgi:DMSO/TMAO reductase YedYZ molybdopterin-dependent catalytic subunit
LLPIRHSKIHRSEAQTLPHNPFFDPTPRGHTDGPFAREEVYLANRNHGVLLEMLRHDVTPAGLHYLLNHFDVPYVPDASAWRLEIGGKVAKPLTLTLDDIRGLPQRTLRVTLECAGSGRAHITPRWQSMPWLHTAVGTSDWTGTPLKHVLERAGLAADVVDVSFTGADRGFDKGHEHHYGRSLTPKLAMHDDVLLVHAMNGQPLLPQHGFPLRLIVPGWYGMASVKWLNRIEALTVPYDGYEQVQSYIYKTSAGDPGVPVTHIRVKSLMVPPGIPDWYTQTRLVEAGRVTVYGRAWSGNGTPIAKVEFGVDGVWSPAELDPPAATYAWRGWRFDWDAARGEHELACRATDINGQTQPLSAAFDRGGFGNNAVHKVQVTAR